jgi:hypothetical protein
VGEPAAIRGARPRRVHCVTPLYNRRVARACTARTRWRNCGLVPQFTTSSARRALNAIGSRCDPMAFVPTRCGLAEPAGLQGFCVRAIPCGAADLRLVMYARLIAFG